MNITLKQITLHSPDELLGYWFVSHDFAEPLGLGHSRDAARALKSAIGPKLARIDYEADAVTVRVSRNDNVIPTLTAIYDLLGWDKAELADVAAQVSAFKRPRARKIAVGDAFLIPLATNLCGLGQVLDIHFKFPTVAVFTSLGTAEELSSLDLTRCEPLTILHIHGNALYKGEWPIIGAAPVWLDPASGPGRKQGEVGSSSHGGDGPIANLLLAHAGLRSWEEGYHDPSYLRKLVLANVRPKEG